LENELGAITPELYGYQAAILENELGAIIPKLMAGSAPNFNHRYMYIYLLRIFYGFFTRGEHNGPGRFIGRFFQLSITFTLKSLFFQLHVGGRFWVTLKERLTALNVYHHCTDIFSKPWVNNDFTFVS
jgi:hypothetical protein